MLMIANIRKTLDTILLRHVQIKKDDIMIIMIKRNRFQQLNARDVTHEHITVVDFLDRILKKERIIRIIVSIEDFNIFLACSHNTRFTTQPAIQQTRGGTGDCTD